MRPLFLLFACLCAQALFSQNIYVRFPDDVLFGGICNFDPAASGQPELFNPDGLPFVLRYEDQIFAVIRPDCCIQIDRFWTLVDTVHHVPGSPCIGVPNPTPFPLTSYNPLIYVGPVVSPITQPGDPWSATEVKIYFTDTATTNYSTFWSADATCYIYDQQIKILDTIPPIAANCPDLPVAIADSTDNDTLFWNDPAWAIPGFIGHDLPEGELNLSVTAYDSCSAADVGASYLLFLDLDQDSTWETVVRSGQGADEPGTIRFGNANNSDYSGGEVRHFDQRPVPVNKRYHFDVERTVADGKATFTVHWETLYGPGGILSAPALLPPGHHKIRWMLDDGCGNRTVCDYPFAVAPAAPVGVTEAISGAFPGGVQAWPNPFQDQVSIRFRLPESDRVHLSIWDSDGRLQLQQGGFFSAGEGNMEVERSALGHAGLWYYTLSSGKFCEAGKLTLLP